ncbi:hypothetical protein EZV62_012502 [Acer yangbiense]|uniref:DUF659 domain-containing protein n=1 Tax=Acer yangbiense TaxID=1000413 RepID=A0A5C7HWT3_9ROSI|nr:hypothetical protein EZV62_012502 [Acer yangbiense]
MSDIRISSDSIGTANITTEDEIASARALNDHAPLWRHVTKLDKMGKASSLPTTSSHNKTIGFSNSSTYYGLNFGLPSLDPKMRKGISGHLEKAFNIGVREQLDVEIARMYLTDTTTIDVNAINLHGFTTLDFCTIRRNDETVWRIENSLISVGAKNAKDIVLDSTASHIYAKVVVDCINGDGHFVIEMGILIEEISKLLQCIPESVIISYGHGLKLPTSYELRTSILKVQEANTQAVVDEVDASDVVKDAALLFKLLDDIVEEVEKDIVVQLVMDNASNYKKAGEILMEKRKRLWWMPCAA